MDPTATIPPGPNGTLAQILCAHRTIDNWPELNPTSPCNSSRRCTLTRRLPWLESLLSTCRDLTSGLKVSTRGGNDNKFSRRVLTGDGALLELVHDAMRRFNSVEKFRGRPSTPPDESAVNFNVVRESPMVRPGVLVDEETKLSSLGGTLSLSVSGERPWYGELWIFDS